MPAFHDKASSPQATAAGDMLENCAEEAAKIVSQAPEIFASIKRNYQASIRKGEALRKKNKNGAIRTNGDVTLL